MADWRQIQARIRKAKNSPDAQAKLNELYQRTRDAMVAWELGADRRKSRTQRRSGKLVHDCGAAFSSRRLAEEGRRSADAARHRDSAAVDAERASRALLGAKCALIPSPTAKRARNRPARTRTNPKSHLRRGMPLALGEIPESHEESASSESLGGVGRAGRRICRWASESGGAGVAGAEAAVARAARFAWIAGAGVCGIAGVASTAASARAAARSGVRTAGARSICA